MQTIRLLIVIALAIGACGVIALFIYMYHR
jgi:nitrogen fixation-related uncharacterized protein